MGFVCDIEANISDFLTSVTVTNERQVRPGYESAVPNTPAEFEARFKSSHSYSTVMRTELCKSSGTRPIGIHSSPYQNSVQVARLGRVSRIHHFLGL